MKRTDSCNVKFLTYLSLKLLCFLVLPAYLFWHASFNHYEQVCKESTDEYRAKLETAHLGLLCLFVTIALGLWISTSIINPMAELQKGTIALQKRKFSYRLPKLGNDEFGELSSMMNTALSDYDELDRGLLVKNNLMDSFAESLIVGNFAIFAKTISFTNSGNDMLVVNNVDGKISTLIGTSAEHGIASSLIHAFVSGALLQLEQFAFIPDEKARNLASLLKKCSTHEHSKTIATTDVVVDASADTICFVNAGTLMPINIGNDKKPSTFELKSQPLGLNLSDEIGPTEIRLKGGECLVFFSNGILSTGLSSHEIFKMLTDLSRQSPEQIVQQTIERLIHTQKKHSLENDISLIVIKRLPATPF